MEFLLIWPWIASFAMITVISTLFFYTPSKKKSPSKLPPEAGGGWPLIGHLFLLSGPEPLHTTLSKMADKYGPIFSVRLGTRRGVVINSWETAKECYRTNDVALSNRPRTAAMGLMGYDFAMFGFDNYGGYWREMRKIAVLRLLSNRKVAALGAAREHHVREMMRAVEGQARVGSVDMARVFGDLTLSLMIRMVAGDVEAEERERWRESIRGFFKMMSVFTVSDVVPYLWWVDRVFGGMHKGFRKIGSEFDKMLQEWLEQKKKKKRSLLSHHEDEDEDDDLMTQMLSIADGVAQEFPCYDADTINKATCQTMMVGGTDTTSIALTWALCLLLNNRHTLRKAQEELDLHVGQARQVKESDIENLVYIQAIIKESMRLLPSIPVNPREAGEDCVVAGYYIPKGTRLFINTWKIQRDPRVWVDPLEFKPERFLTTHREVDVLGLHFELLPFGGGRRVCPAISFALRTVQLALASFLHGFDVDTPSGGAVDMGGRFGTTNMKATPLEVYVKPRLSRQLYA